MKLLVCDVEGTIFKAKYKIDGTDYASTMWQPLAHCLGNDAINEELATHKKWENKEYNNYMEWVEATCEIHKNYKLSKTQFETLIHNAEYMPGVEDFFRTLDRAKYIPILVSGGFEELIHRAQHELNIKHGTAACKYIFNDETGHLESWRIEPTDFTGKFNYIRKFFDEYKLNRLTDWIFIGDGKNDVDIAKRAPLAFGINAHADLAKEVKYNVSDFAHIRTLMNENEHDDIEYLSHDAILSPADVARIEKNERVVRERDALAEEIIKINAELERQVLAMNTLYEDLAKAQAALDTEKAKRKKLATSQLKLKESSEKMQRLQLEYAVEIKELTEQFDEASQIARAELAEELLGLKNKVSMLDAQLQETHKILHDKNLLLQQSTEEIAEHEKLIAALNNQATEDDKANHEEFANRFEKLVYQTLTARHDKTVVEWEVIANFDSNTKKNQPPGVVDCLVITNSCIVVIEAKSYLGAIISDGDVENNPWYLSSGGYKRLIECKSKNPYQQVKRYCDNMTNHVESRLQKNMPVRGIVVFPPTSDFSFDCTINKYYHVVALENLVDTIKSLEATIRKQSGQKSYHTPEEVADALLGRSIQVEKRSGSAYRRSR